MAFTKISKVALIAAAFSCITAVPAAQDVSEAIDQAIDDVDKALQDSNSELSQAVSSGVDEVNKFLECVTQEKCQNDSSQCTECFVNPNPQDDDVKKAEDCIKNCSEGPSDKYVECYSGCFNDFTMTGGAATPKEDTSKDGDNHEHDHDDKDHDHSDDKKEEQDPNVRTDVTRDEDGNYVDSEGKVITTSEDEDGNTVDEEGKIIKIASESTDDSDDNNEESSAQSLLVSISGACAALLAIM